MSEMKDKLVTLEGLKSFKGEFIDEIKEVITSQGGDFAEMGHWADDNPYGEDRLYRFVTIVGNEREIGIADSESQIVGTSNVKENVGFIGYYHDRDEFDPTKVVVSILGVAPVKTLDNSIQANDRVMSDDNGYAVRSSNNCGYRVLEVISEGLLSIAVSPNTDMVQRIKTDMTEVNERIDEHDTKISQVKEDIIKNSKAVDLFYKTLKNEFKGDWNSLIDLIDTGDASKTFSIGDQIITTWTDTSTNKTYELPLDVAHFGKAIDEQGVEHEAMYLRWHYTTPFGVQFSQYQAFYYCNEELPAGTYSFEIGESMWKAVKGKIYQFTLTQPVPQGGQLCLPNGCPNSEPSAWTIRSYPSRTSNEVIETVSVTEVTEVGASTSFGLWKRSGTDKLNSIDHVAYGDNRWIFSDLRQWLNTDLPRNEWWHPLTIYSRPPNHISRDGFLAGFPEDFKAIFKKFKVTTILPNTTSFLSQGVDNFTYDYWFLPSLEQIGCNKQVSGEGEAFEYFKQLLGSKYPLAWYTNTDEMKHYSIANHSSSQYVRFRSANVHNGYNTWFAFSSGYVHGYDGAVNFWAFAPLIVLYKGNQ